MYTTCNGKLVKDETFLSRIISFVDVIFVPYIRKNLQIIENNGLVKLMIGYKIKCT